MKSTTAVSTRLISVAAFMKRPQPRPSTCRHSPTSAVETSSATACEKMTQSTTCCFRTWPRQRTAAAPTTCAPIAPMMKNLSRRSGRARAASKTSAWQVPRLTGAQRCFLTVSRSRSKARRAIRVVSHHIQPLRSTKRPMVAGRMFAGTFTRTSCPSRATQRISRLRQWLFPTSNCRTTPWISTGSRVMAAWSFACPHRSGSLPPSNPFGTSTSAMKKDLVLKRLHTLPARALCRCSRLPASHRPGGAASARASGGPAYEECAQPTFPNPKRSSP